MAACCAFSSRCGASIFGLTPNHVVVLFILCGGLFDCVICRLRDFQFCYSAVLQVC